MNIPGTINSSCSPGLFVKIISDNLCKSVAEHGERLRLFDPDSDSDPDPDYEHASTIYHLPSTIYQLSTINYQLPQICMVSGQWCRNESIDFSIVQFKSKPDFVVLVWMCILSA